MKAFRRFLGVFLSLLLLASLPVAAMAEEYDLVDGYIEVQAYVNEDGNDVQYVNMYDDDYDFLFSNLETAETVITGSAATSHSLWVGTKGGGTANVTVKDVQEAYYFDIWGDGGSANITVEGTNNFTGIYSDIELEGTVTFTGSGTLNYADQDGAALNITETNVVVDGPTLTATGGDYGIYLEQSALTVTKGSVTGTATADGGSGMYFEESTLSAPDGSVIADGADVTAAALADPTILNAMATVTVAGAAEPEAAMTASISDGSSKIILYGAPYGTTFEKTGEPDDAAMAILSDGIDGECIYKGSFAFTDDLPNHGGFFFILTLPEYVGQRVIITTIVNGAQVRFNRWVGADGSISIRVHDLGDFAVFLA